MKKKTPMFIGIVTLSCGIILIGSQIYRSTNATKIKGEIVRILERKQGTEYSIVSKGSIYPCKLKLSYSDSNGDIKDFTTSYEQEPCSSFFTRYHRVGDKLNLLYKENSNLNPTITQSNFYILISLFMISIGTVCIYLTERHRSK